MSGLALSAFIASLILAFVALMGLWVVMLLPLVLGFLAWTRVDPERYRGRALGMWAIGISLLGGTGSYFMHRDMADRLKTTASNVLAALQAKETSRLEDWLTPDARKSGGAERLQQRFAEVVAEVGAYKGSVEAGGFFTGAMSTIVPPRNLTEIAPPATATAPIPGEALWVRATFERETIEVEFVVGGGGQTGIQNALGQMDRAGPQPVVTDVRFFRSAKTPKGAQDG